MQIYNMKCTSCGAPISNIPKENTAIECPYCRSMLFVKDYTVCEADASEEMENVCVPLCCVEKKLAENDTLKTVVQGMSDTIYENPNSDSIIPILNRILEGKKEAATVDSFPKDYEKINRILQDTKVAGEKLIFYKTAALLGFNKLKSGMFITTDRVGYIEGKKIFQVAYKDLDTLVIDIVYKGATYWYPNGDENIFLSAMAVSNREFGAILAYIVSRTNEEANHQKSVVLRMK